MVTVRGRVVEQTNEGADEHADKLAKNTLVLINILVKRIILIKKRLS